MDTFTPKERAVNFSKNEKRRFQALLEKYKDVLFSKKTDNISNLLKNKTWAAIHAEFNAGGDQPRTLRQLKAKFDNMKKAARKDASQERQSRIKTGGWPPAPPVQQETEWFRTLMPISMDGLPSVIDDDFIENESVATNQITNGSQEVINLLPLNNGANDVQVDEQENINPSENIMCSISEAMSVDMDNIFDSRSPASLLRTPVSKPLRIHKKTPANSCHDIKTEILTKMREYEENIYKLKLKHMQEKREEEKEIHNLQKKSFY